jgi:hypothetical protein
MFSNVLHVNCQVYCLWCFVELMCVYVAVTCHCCTRYQLPWPCGIASFVGANFWVDLLWQKKLKQCTLSSCLPSWLQMMSSRGTEVDTSYLLNYQVMPNVSYSPVTADVALYCTQGSMAVRRTLPLLTCDIVLTCGMLLGRISSRGPLCTDVHSHRRVVCIIFHLVPQPQLTVRLCDRTLDFVTPLGRVLHDKLAVAQLLKKFYASNGTRRFITALIRAGHCGIDLNSLFSEIISCLNILLVFGFFDGKTAEAILFVKPFAFTIKIRKAWM